MKALTFVRGCSINDLLSGWPTAALVIDDAVSLLGIFLIISAVRALRIKTTPVSQPREDGIKYEVIKLVILSQRQRYLRLLVSFTTCTIMVAIQLIIEHNSDAYGLGLDIAKYDSPYIGRFLSISMYGPWLTAPCAAIIAVWVFLYPSIFRGGSALIKLDRRIHRIVIRPRMEIVAPVSPRDEA